MAADEDESNPRHTDFQSVALTVRGSSALIPDSPSLPPAILAAGKPAETAWHDFFDGQIANPHTRKAYNRAVRHFLAWVEEKGLPLKEIRAGHVGQFLQGHAGSLPTQKQHMAGLRRFFDLLVERHIILMNPASSARTARYSVVEGKTAEITREQIQALLAAIDTSSIVGMRDRALIRTLIYTTARAGAVAKLRRQDFYISGNQAHLRFAEKGGKSREIPVRHDLELDLNAYLEAAGLLEAAPKAPIFPTAVRREKRFTANPMKGEDVARMIRRRMKAAGLPRNLTAHSFRVAAITDLIKQGVPIEDVQYLAGHADARTTRLYDRSERRVTRNIVERIGL